CRSSGEGRCRPGLEVCTWVPSASLFFISPSPGPLSARTVPETQSASEAAAPPTGVCDIAIQLVSVERKGWSHSRARTDISAQADYQGLHDVAVRGRSLPGFFARSEEAGQDRGRLLPIAHFLAELLAAGARQPVVLGSPIVVGHAPLGDDVTLLLEPE